jgi:hypothetical protein
MKIFWIHLKEMTVMPMVVVMVVVIVVLLLPAVAVAVVVQCGDGVCAAQTFGLSY